MALTTFLTLAARSLINVNCVGTFGEIWQSSLRVEDRTLTHFTLAPKQSQNGNNHHSLFPCLKSYLLILKKQKSVSPLSNSHSAVLVTSFMLNSSTLKIFSHRANLEEMQLQLYMTIFFKLRIRCLLFN